MTTAEQLADIRSRSFLLTNTNIRQVQGGYVVAGQIQYVEHETGAILASQQAEGVNPSPEGAAQMALNYLRTGNFEGTQPAPAPAPASPLGAPATI